MKANSCSAVALIQANHIPDMNCKDVFCPVQILHRPGCLLAPTVRRTKNERESVFSELRCTRETAAAAPDINPNCYC